MPDENRFSGLGDAVDDDATEEGTDESAASDESTVSDQSTATDEPGVQDAGSDGGSATAAFPFDATTKNTFYVRGPTLERLQDTEAVVDAKLRTEHGVRNLTGREFHDAVLRVAADRPGELIDAIIASRDGGMSDDD